MEGELLEDAGGRGSGAAPAVIPAGRDGDDGSCQAPPGCGRLHVTIAFALAAEAGEDPGVEGGDFLVKRLAGWGDRTPEGIGVAEEREGGSPTAAKGQELAIERV